VCVCVRVCVGGIEATMMAVQAHTW